MEKLFLQIDGLGNRDIIKEYPQIIWFWEQYSKNYKHQAHKTRFWLDLLERYEKILFENQAYELLSFLKEKVNATQIQRRKDWRHKMEEKAKVEMNNWKEWKKNAELKKELTSIQSYN